MAVLSGGAVKIRRPTAISGNASHTPAGGVTSRVSATAERRANAAQTSLHQHQALHGPSSTLKAARKLR